MQILIAEDSALYRALLSRRLREWGFTAWLSEDGESAWKMHQQPGGPRLVLLDWVLPGIDGVELCQRIRRAEGDQGGSYIIVLSGNSAEKHKLAAFQAGADDYLTKPFNDSDLKARLLIGKRVLELQGQLSTARDAVHFADTYDGLTGVLNRKEVLALLARELERASKGSRALGIVLVNIDHFRKVNDTLGYAYGDQVLKEVARRCRAKLGPYDGIGRYGEEEFLLILRDCDVVATLGKADEVCNLVAARPITLSGTGTTVTVSIGAVVAAQEGDYGLSGVLTGVEQGLRAAKYLGRNRVEHIELATTNQDNVLCREISAKTFQPLRLHECVPQPGGSHAQYER